MIWSPRAKRDLAAIWHYYVHVATPEIADKLLREIEGAARQLSQNARRWRSREELAPGLRSVLVNPYVIFYRFNDEVVQIVRVLHGRRNLDAIFSQMKER